MVYNIKQKAPFMNRQIESKRIHSCLLDKIKNVC